MKVYLKSATIHCSAPRSQEIIQRPNQTTGSRQWKKVIAGSLNLIFAYSDDLER
jgi:hypothetical protein